MMIQAAPVLLIVAAAVAAPVPNQKPLPSVAALQKAMGKSHLSSELRAVGRMMGEDPTINYALWNQDVHENREETHFYLRWKAKGLELCFGMNNLHTAWMFNDKTAGFKKYVGELPEGLTFEDNPTTVEKKLGKPEIIFRSPPDAEPGKEVRVDMIYKQKGVCVTIHKPVTGELVVAAIALFTPGDAPDWCW